MTDTPSLPEHLTTSEREALFPLPDPALAGLRARLVQQADDAGLVEVAYRTLDTPVGPLLLAATAQGLVRVAFEREGFDAVLSALATRVSPRVLEAPGRLDEAAAEALDRVENELPKTFPGAIHQSVKAAVIQRLETLKGSLAKLD